MKIIKKMLKYVTVAELYISAITFGMMVICYFISVVNRNVIKSSMPWTEELALYAMVYMALLGMELGLRDGTQVCVTAITSKLEGSVIGRVLDYISRIVLIVFVFMMFRYGNALVMKQIQVGQTSPVMKVPMYLLYLSLSISFALTLISQVVILIGKITGIPMEEVTEIDKLIDSMFQKNKGGQS